MRIGPMLWSVSGLLFSCTLLPAGDWPQFRGPMTDGIALDARPPTTWSAQDNVRWKAPLPRPANGSPIVVAGRVFVTSAEDEEGRQRSLYCFDADTGQQLWVQSVHLEQVMPTHETNPYASTTPASNGQHVVVWHASAGLYCYDLEGNELWSRDLGHFQHMWGYGTSPIIYKDRVILHTGPGSDVFVAAFRLENGDLMWQTDEPLEGDGQHNLEQKYMGSWSTPVVAQVDGLDQVIVVMPTRVNAYNPDSGELIWTCHGVRHDRGDLAYSSAVIADDLVFVTGGFRGPTMAIRLGGEGDVTDSHMLYRIEGSPQSIGTGIHVDGYIYRPNAGPGTIECLDVKTGQSQWKDRAAGENYWSSIVMADGLLYVTNQAGTTIVFKPNPERLDEVARNPLGEPSNSTPAIAGNRIYLRTSDHLWCIEN